MISNGLGFMKLVFDRTNGMVLGVHTCGDHSCDLINYGAELVNRGATIFDIRDCVFPAVTYHQLYHFVASRAKHQLAGVHALSASIIWRQINVALHKSKGFKEQALQEFFGGFDDDHNGFISMNELYDTLHDRLELNISKANVPELMEEVDDNGNSAIEYNEFKRVLETVRHHFSRTVGDA
eukprot:gnl/MRDRNA2_/MRDRNA2_74465_c0_seq1.p1 gnl/MRDRNA2_/MRDRNA2_74465_c0~~gnl/MRDRNA2_/MRDRNA2_74465_c0_seq1.p1  ORF type:complete len:181 (+),score=23.20 gnl/MRDRNA2_/MRDRNA2_74465_c0_seq1:238-780(+)